MSPIQTDGVPAASRATAMSSQSTFVAPGTVTTAAVAPVARSSAKKRLVSPLSFCMYRMPGETYPAAIPLASVIRESGIENSTRVGDASAGVATAQTAVAITSATATRSARRDVAGVITDLV